MTEQNEQPNKPTANRRPDGRFGSGNNANPSGRPKKQNCIPDLMDQLGSAELTDGKTREQALVENIWEWALAGDRYYVGLLLDRILGKPKATVDVTTDNVIQVVWEEPWNKTEE